MQLPKENIHDIWYILFVIRNAWDLNKATVEINASKQQLFVNNIPVGKRKQLKLLQKTSSSERKKS